jgi:hypothetical protein
MMIFDLIPVPRLMELWYENENYINYMCCSTSILGLCNLVDFYSSCVKIRCQEMARENFAEE